MKRTSESAMALAIVRYLRRTPDKRAMMAEIREGLPRYTRLTKADRAESPTRPGEQLWMQVVRNLRSHGTGRKYGLRNIEGGFSLEAKPPAHVAKTLRELQRELQP